MKNNAPDVRYARAALELVRICNRLAQAGASATPASVARGSAGRPLLHVENVPDDAEP